MLNFFLLSWSPASERVEEDVLREFIRDRQLNGDLITKYSDMFFQRGVKGVIDDEPANVDYSFQPSEEVSYTSWFSICAF